MLTSVSFVNLELFLLKLDPALPNDSRTMPAAVILFLISSEKDEEQRYDKIWCILLVFPDPVSPVKRMDFGLF